MLSFISAFAFGAAAVLACILIYVSGFFAGEQNKKVSPPKATVIINNSASKSRLYTAKGNVRVLNKPEVNTEMYVQTRANLINEALGSGLSYNKKIACYQKHARITKKF